MRVVRVLVGLRAYKIHEMFVIVVYALGESEANHRIGLFSGHYL